MTHSRQFKLNMWIWIIIVANMVFDIIWFQSHGIQLQVNHPYQYGTLLCITLVIALVSFFLKSENTFYFGSIFGQLVLGNIAASTLQYAGPVFAFPLTDPVLIRLDHCLGFDWLSFVKWIDTLNVQFVGILGACYLLVVLLSVLVLFVLFAYEHSAHAQRFVIILYFSVILCVVLSAVFPAVAGYVFYNLQVHDLHNLSSAVSRIHEHLFFALYNHTVHELSIPNVGIVTFPSYHAVIAAALMYASLPLRRLRWFIIPYGMLVLFSIVPVGGHYLVDVIGGLVITLTGIWIAEKLLPVKKDFAPVSA